MNEFENVEMQQASADGDFEAGFLEGLNGEEYAEDQAEQQQASAAEPQEESAEEEHSEEQANSEEGSAEESAPNTEGEKPEEKPAEQTEEEKFEVTFMGEKKLLSKEEMRDYAEKGMNLDRVRQQLSNSNAMIAKLEAELAAPRAGSTLLPLMKAYAEANGGTLEGLTQNMMEAVRAAGKTVAKPAESNYMREKAIAQWQDFMAAYPDIKDPRTELAPEIWDAIKSGLSPRAAYIEHRQKGIDKALADKDAAIAERDGKIAELEQKIKTLELNEKNKKKSAGGLKSSAEAPERDDFFDGFMSI